MKGTKNIIALIVLSLIWFSACEEGSDWELEQSTELRLVVEAILSNQEVIQTIQLSTNKSSLNGNVSYVDDATVSVEANGVMYNFKNNSEGTGIYESEFAFAVSENLNYLLEINWNGNNYIATSELSTVAPLQEIGFVEVGNAGLLTFDNFAPLFSPNQQSMYEVEIDWSDIDDNLPNRAKTFFYTFNSLHISEFIPPPQDTLHFPAGSIVTIHKYGLDDEFASYLRSLMIETDWKGNFFYSSPENLISNIQPEGLGFFATCAIVSDTIVAGL